MLSCCLCCFLGSSTTSRPRRKKTPRRHRMTPLHSSHHPRSRMFNPQLNQCALRTHLRRVTTSQKLWKERKNPATCAFKRCHQRNFTCSPRSSTLGSLRKPSSSVQRYIQIQSSSPTSCASLSTVLTCGGVRPVCRSSRSTRD